MTSDVSVLLTGTTGYLVQEVDARLEALGIAFAGLGRAEGFDLGEPFSLEEVLDQVVEGLDAPPLLIHLAAMSRMDECEAEPERAFRTNAEATGVLASVLARSRGRVVYVSTDLVFDGENAPYTDDDEPRPTSIYGKSKAEGERMVLADSSGLVIRIPLLFGPSFDGKRGASDTVLAALGDARELRLFTDEWRTPLSVREAAEQIVALALDSTVTGIRHLPGPERLSRHELGVRSAEEAGLDPGAILEASRLEMPGPRRPCDVSLATTMSDQEGNQQDDEEVG